MDTLLVSTERQQVSLKFRNSWLKVLTFISDILKKKMFLVFLNLQSKPCIITFKQATTSIYLTTEYELDIRDFPIVQGRCQDCCNHNYGSGKGLRTCTHKTVISATTMVKTWISFALNNCSKLSSIVTCLVIQSVRQV